MKCVQLIEGCPECALDEQALEPDHDCGPDDDVLISLCRVWGDSIRESEEAHRLSHEPIRCEECGGLLDDKRGNNRLVRRVCPSGWCQVLACPDCAAEWSSFGPVECPTCGSFGKPERIKRLRRMYARRRR